MKAFLGIDHVPFNHRLREARLERGWSRAALAQYAGVSPALVGRAEALKQWPSAEVREKLCLTLALPEDYLFPERAGDVVRTTGGAKRTTTVVPDALTLESLEARRMVGPGPEVGIEDSERASDVGAAVDALPERLRGVVTRRFGLDGDEPWTLAELAASLGVTPERARQLESAALRKLRHPRFSSALRAYL